MELRKAAETGCSEKTLCSCPLEQSEKKWLKLKHEELRLDTDRDFPRRIFRRLLWSWCHLFCFVKKTEFLLSHFRGPKSGLLTSRAMDPIVFRDYLGLFPRMVSVLLQEGKGARLGPLLPKVQQLAFETCYLSHFLQENFISFHQPARSTRSARVGVSREPGNGPGTEAVTLRGYFGN